MHDARGLAEMTLPKEIEEAAEADIRCTALFMDGVEWLWQHLSERAPKFNECDFTHPGDMLYGSQAAERANNKIVSLLVRLVELESTLAWTIDNRMG